MIANCLIRRILTVILVATAWVHVHAADNSVKKTAVEIDYKRAVYDFAAEQKKVILEGPITIKTDTLLVTCDDAEILSSRKEGETDFGTSSSIGSIDYILAKGNVEITQAGSKALAGKAEIFPAERRLVLEDNPRIVDQYGIVSGYRIVFLQGERRIKIESGEEQQRSHIKLTDVEDIGFLMGEEDETTNHNEQP